MRSMAKSHIGVHNIRQLLPEEQLLRTLIAKKKKIPKMDLCPEEIPSFSLLEQEQAVPFRHEALLDVVNRQPSCFYSKLVSAQL